MSYDPQFFCMGKQRPGQVNDAPKIKQVVTTVQNLTTVYAT